MVMHTKLPLLYGVVLGLISGFSKIYFYFPSYSRTIPELLGYVPRGLKMCFLDFNESMSAIGKYWLRGVTVRCHIGQSTTVPTLTVRSRYLTVPQYPP